MYLYPDFDTWLIMNWEKAPYGKVARLICDVYKSDKTPFEGDPRFILKRNLKSAYEMGFDKFNVDPTDIIDLVKGTINDIKHALMKLQCQALKLILQTRSKFNQLAKGFHYSVRRLITHYGILRSGNFLHTCLPAFFMR